MKRKSILFIVSIVLVLTLAFALVACNDGGGNYDEGDDNGTVGNLPNDDDNGGENDNDEDDAITELSEDMTLDEVKSFLSNVENLTCIVTTVGSGVCYVNENCNISVITIASVGTMYVATIVEDNRVYDLSRIVYSDEHTEDTIEYTWSEIGVPDDVTEEIEEDSGSYFGYLENLTITVTTKEGIEGYVIVVEGTQHVDYGENGFDVDYTMVCYDFNKTEMPSIDEYFPNYKELAVEYVEPAEEE